MSFPVSSVFDFLNWLANEKARETKRRTFRKKRLQLACKHDISLPNSN